MGSPSSADFLFQDMVDDRVQGPDPYDTNRRLERIPIFCRWNASKKKPARPLFRRSDARHVEWYAILNVDRVQRGMRPEAVRNARVL